MKLLRRALGIALVSVLAATILPATAVFATDPTPTIAVSSNKHVYVAGQTAAITVVVSGAGSGKYLRLTVTRANGTSSEVDSGAYDDTFHFAFAMYIDSTLTTELLDADKTTVLATDQKVFPVQAALGTAIGG